MDERLMFEGAAGIAAGMLRKKSSSVKSGDKKEKEKEPKHGDTRKKDGKDQIYNWASHSWLDGDKETLKKKEKEQDERAKKARDERSAEKDKEMAKKSPSKAKALALAKAKVKKGGDKAKDGDGILKKGWKMVFGKARKVDSIQGVGVESLMQGNHTKAGVLVHHKSQNLGQLK